MATANSSSDSMPPLPNKNTPHRSYNFTPSPEPYDQPKPPRSDGKTTPPTPAAQNAPGQVNPYPQSYSIPQPASRSSSQAGSRPPSINGGSRSVTPTGNQYDSIQPYPQPYGSNPPTPTSNQPFIQPAMQPYPGMQSITSGGTQQPAYQMQTFQTAPATYGAPHQPFNSPNPYPLPPAKTGMSKHGDQPTDRAPTWLVLSVITIFINPIFGGIALCFSLMSMGARSKIKRKNYGQIAKHCCIVGIGLSVILCIVTGIIIGTNNRGWRRDQPEAP